jgi:hypothetical protein
VVGGLAEDLHADADFLRVLQGDASGSPDRMRRGPRSTSNSPRRPFLVIGIAFAVGLAVGTFVQWRSLVEPRH